SSRAFHGDNSVLKRLVASQNNQRLLGYRPTSALHSCSPRCNRPPRANPNPERAEVRHTAFSSRAGPYCGQVRFNVTTSGSHLTACHSCPVNASHATIGYALRRESALVTGARPPDGDKSLPGTPAIVKAHRPMPTRPATLS